MSALKRVYVWFLLFVLLFGIVGFTGRAKVYGRNIQEKKVEELIKTFDQRNWQEAVDELSDIGEPAVEPLIRTLKDRKVKGWFIHARAINALAKIGTQRSVEAIIKFFKDKEANEYARGSAAISLSSFEMAETATALIEALEDESQFVRWKSVQALGELGQEENAAALAVALKDEDKYVRAAAARALGKLKSKEAVNELVKAFVDGHWLVRLNARNALLEIDKGALEQLIEALKDEDGQVRWQAAWVLGRIKSQEAVEPLIELLGDGDWMVRDEAAVALVRINSEKAVEALKEVTKHKTEYVRVLAAWVLQKMKSDRGTEEEKTQATRDKKIPPDEVYFNQKTYPYYPEMLDFRPDIPSPHTTLDGAEIVTAFMKYGKYLLMPVTVENGKLLNYKERQWGKGRQLEVDSGDFPKLAKTGLHSEIELDQTKMITGRSIAEITELGRPGRSSGAGFMSDDEDIISVLRGDNRLVRKLGLRHPQMAKPLFHIWNMILRDYESGRLGRFWNRIEHISYNGKKVLVKVEGTRGWQESLFDDEILGMFQIEIWRELSKEEEAFLNEKYPHLSDEQISEFVKKLSYIHTGEMVPYYIMRYGFYEGHTDYRADPIAIAWIFGFKSLEEIEKAFDGKLYEALTQYFTR